MSATHSDSDRRKRSWIVPAPRLAALIAAAAPVWLLSGFRWGLSFALLVTAAVIAAVVYELVTLAPVRMVTIAREAPARTGLGDPTELRYTVHSAWPRMLRVLIHESLPPALRPDSETPLSLDVVGPPVIGTSTVTPVARGRHALGPLTVHVRGQLGVLTRSQRIELDDTISVAPSLSPVKRFRLRALQARTSDAGPRVLRHRGESLAFSGLRPYTPGDDPRRIDWKATARQRIPITREYNLEQGQTVLIAVDAGRLMTQQEGAASRFEQALSASLVLATVAADGGDKVGLLLFDDSVRAFLPPREGMTAVRAIRDTLVAAEPTLVEPDYAAAFATIAARQRRRALVVLFSDVIDARSSRAMITHTTHSASRHLHVVVAMRSESLFQAGVPAGLASGDSLYVNAAAEELVLAREEALHRMRRAGVTVVDVPSGSVSAAVVDRYLEIKGRGSL
ncbi:MAG TPA: DUF58 domain-containing protein [Gemmatimonadaceae bacterium]